MTNYQILEEFETTSGTTWQKREYSSGKIVYRNSEDFRVNRKQQSYASASKHRIDTSNEQIGDEKVDEVIYNDEWNNRIVQGSELYGDYFEYMQEWYKSEPEIEISYFKTQRDEYISDLVEKIKKQGEDEPSWKDGFDNYHFYLKYYVVKDGEIFDVSRRYTKSLDSIDELKNDFIGVINELVNIASGYDNILVVEYGIQAKVIADDE